MLLLLRLGDEPAQFVARTVRARWRQIRRRRRLLLLLSNVSRSGSGSASIPLPASGDPFAIEALLLAEAVQEADDDLADLG